MGSLDPKSYEHCQIRGRIFPFQKKLSQVQENG